MRVRRPSGAFNSAEMSGIYVVVIRKMVQGVIYIKAVH